MNTRNLLLTSTAGLLLFVSGADAQSQGPGYGYNNGGGRYTDGRWNTPDYFGQLRGLVSQTQNDLQYAAGFPERKDDARKRYFDAQGHLSTFDRKLVRGRFDQGELDKSINKIRDILAKNVLQVTSRNALLRDLDQLQAARYRRG